MCSDCNSDQQKGFGSQWLPDYSLQKTGVGEWSEHLPCHAGGREFESLIAKIQHLQHGSSCPQDKLLTLL
jgi:hypothetical protein